MFRHAGRGDRDQSVLKAADDALHLKRRLLADAEGHCMESRCLASRRELEIVKENGGQWHHRGQHQGKQPSRQRQPQIQRPLISCAVI